MFIDLDDNNYNSINISSVKEIEKTEDGTTIYQVVITFKNGQQLIKSYNNKSDADAELEKILSAGPSGGGGGDLSNYYTKSESDANDAETLNSAKSYVDTEIGKLPATPEFSSFSSTSSNKDVGRELGSELNFSTLKPGLYHYKNYSSQTSTGKFYYKYNTDDVPHTISASTSTSIAYSEFEVKILKDTSKGTKTLDTPIFAIVTFINTSSYISKSYKFYVSNSSTGNVSMAILVNTPSVSDVSNASSKASSALSNASTALQTANTAQQNCQSLDTRVAALENASGGGGGQAEYITNRGGISYPPTVTWDASANYFNYSKIEAVFKDGTDENLYLTLLSGGTPDKISVNFNYYYMSEQLDTSDFTIPNVVLKLYDPESGDDLCTLDVGDVELKYNSGSNRWTFDKYDISYQYIMSGIRVACKMFYGESSGSGVKVIKYSDLKIPQGSESALFDYIANYNIDLNIPAFFLFDFPSGMTHLSVQVNNSPVMIDKNEMYTLVRTQTEMGYQYTIMQSINSRPDVRQFVIEYSGGMMHPAVTGGYTQFTSYGGH